MFRQAHSHKRTDLKGSEWREGGTEGQVEGEKEQVALITEGSQLQ